MRVCNRPIFRTINSISKLKVQNNLSIQKSVTKITITKVQLMITILNSICSKSKVLKLESTFTRSYTEPDLFK